MSEIPTADWTWINAAADRFEHAWKTGQRPRIEDYLLEVEESRRPRLLEELLRVEVELRRRAGEEPKAEDFGGRFPHGVALIDAIFGPVPNQPDATSTAAVTPGQEAEDADLAPGSRVALLRRLRVDSRAGTRRYGSRLQGPSNQSQPAGCHQDDPVGRAGLGGRAAAVPE